MKQHKHHLLFSAITFLVFLSLTSLTHAQKQTNDYDFGAETIDEIEAVKPLPVELVEEKDTSKQEEIALPTTEEENQSSEGKKFTTILDVRDADITALVKAISKATKRNFIIDSRVKGKVTVHLPTPVSQDEALKIFDSVLLLNGFTTVPAGKNIWKIIPSKEAKQTTIPLYDEQTKDRSDVLVTELLPLKNVKAEDMQQLLTQFISADGGINSFSGTNSLLIIDSAQNISRIRKLVSELDVPARDQDITIIPILYAEAKDVADKVTDILGEGGKETSGTTGTAAAIQPGATQQRPAIGGRASAAKTASGQSVQQRALPIKIIPDERTNSIIVVADPEMTAKVRALCEKLDSEIDRSSGRFNVYRLKHADAEDLAEILNGLVSGNPVTPKKKDNSGSSLSRSSRNNSSGYDSGYGSSSRNRSSRSSSRTGSSDTRDFSATSRSTATGSTTTGSKEGGRANFEGEITIAADSPTNSLIISASKGDFMRLKEIIEQLDVKRRQVLVEATLLEVGLTGEEGMGIELSGSAGNDNGAVIGQTNWGQLTTLLKDPASLSDLTIAAASTGTITLPGGLVIPSQTVLVSAVSKNQNVNVLSTPTILSTDNEEAEIVVGENVPIVTSTSKDSTNLNNSYNDIERQDVGITLRITPQISSNDYVLLRMFVEISSVVQGTKNDANGPTTTIRTTETTVEVKNNQMIITGGLLSDDTTEATRGIPYLQDIPVLGNLFKRTDETVKRNNLLVLLTPRIIYDQYEARDQTKKFAGKLENIISDQQVKPSRADVLRNEDMDRVTEEISTEQVAPTTVTAPQSPLSEGQQKALERTKQRLMKMSTTATSAGEESLKAEPKTTKQNLPEKHDDEDSINVRVSPRLPEAKTEEHQVTPKTKVEGNKPSASAATRTPTLNYVVMRELKSDPGIPSSNKLRFVDDKGLIGLAITGDVKQGDQKYFRTGVKYGFNDGDTEYTFVVLGQYNNTEEAKRINSNLEDMGKWNIVTPEQSLSWFQK